MGRVRIVWGSASGPTALSSYDAALAAAGVHDYNLLQVSSVLPIDTSVEFARTAPDLGPIGGRLTVVEARNTVRTTDREPTPDDVAARPATGERATVCAGLGWAQATDGHGIVYEGTATDPENVHRAIEDGLRAGCALRELSPARSDRVVLSTDGVTERVDTDGEREGIASDEPKRIPPADRTGNETYLTAVVLAAYGESEPIL